MFRKTLLVIVLFTIGCGGSEKLSNQPQQSHPNDVWDGGPGTKVACRNFFKDVPAAEYEGARKHVREAAEAWSKKLEKSEHVDVILVDVKYSSVNSTKVKAVTRVIFLQKVFAHGENVEVQ